MAGPGQVVERSAPPPCPGCGLVVPPVDGPTHPYIGASPGCWAMFTELSLRPLGSLGGGELLTDAYAVQHPGVPGRRAIQSVCVHLILLCATVERQWPSSRAVWLRRRALAQPMQWRWLEPPLPVGTLTVAHLAAVSGADERGHRLREWAEDVWAAYRLHHGEVRGWLDDLLQ
jgi:hypothetical protein